MKNKKAVENTLLAVVGIGLITTAVVLLAKRTRSYKHDSLPQKKVFSYDDYEEDEKALTAFSETGILL